jgi:ketosteroid isomerase-like protein
MPEAHENFRLLTEYYASYGDGGAEGIARMLSFYASDKTTYIAGDSVISGHMKSQEESAERFRQLMELNGGDMAIVGSPTILVAGDTVVAALVYERHQRPDREPVIVPRLCVYEVAEGKLKKAFAWQLESGAFDEYYPRQS